VKKNLAGSQRLGTVLAQAVESSSLAGIALWDTMRKGSDYWRPGKFLSAAVEWMPLELQRQTSFHLRDEFCPPAQLLDEFRHVSICKKVRGYCCGCQWHAIWISIQQTICMNLNCVPQLSTVMAIN